MPQSNIRKVFVINDGPHDYAAAEQYGELVFLSSGPIDRYATNRMYREFMEILQYSTEKDYILSTSLTTMNMIAASIMTHLHGRINLLIHHNGVGYKERNIVFPKREEAQG
jgi:hypothetical protein